MSQALILIGGGGHAGVLAEIARLLGKTIIGFVALREGRIPGFPEIPYLGEEKVLLENFSRDIKLINGVGSISVDKNSHREQLFSLYKAQGYFFETLVHPSSIIAKDVIMGEGSQVMPGAILQPNVIIGKNTIINTAAVIEHDCAIGHHVHVGPRGTLSGNVKVGDYAFIGVGATLIQGLCIGEKAMICAGTTVTKDVNAMEKIH